MLCVHRYFEQYGVCAQCPTARSPASILASVGFPLLLVAVVGALVALRAMMARGMMKVSGCADVVTVTNHRDGWQTALMESWSWW